MELNTNRAQDPFDLNAKQCAFLLASICIISTILSRIIYAPCDDAYIFYVYVKNLLAGNGLTFNGMAVWGFTSPMWTGALSLISLLGIPTHIGGEILSTVSGWFALWATYFLGRNCQLTRLQALAPVILLAGTGDFVFYSAVGLEQVFFTALTALTGAFALSKRSMTTHGTVITAALMSTLILTRPEGVLVCGLLLLGMLINFRSVIKPFLCGILLMCFSIPVFFSLHLYFGDWLPNTFYAKSNAGLANYSHGIQYLQHSLQRYFLTAVISLSIAIFSIIKRKHTSQSAAWSMLAISTLWLIYVTLQGGDNMVGGRVLIPILPLIYVAVISLAPKPSPHLLVAGAILLSIAFFYLYLNDKNVTAQATAWRRSYKIRHSAALYLRDNFPPTTVVALNPAGIIPYYSELPTIDMLGLNNWEIAHHGKRNIQLRFGHQIGDGNYVLSQQPNVILLGGSLHKQPGNFISDLEIWASSEFQEHYSATNWLGIGTAYILKNAPHKYTQTQ